MKALTTTGFILRNRRVSPGCSSCRPACRPAWQVRLAAIGVRVAEVCRTTPAAGTTHLVALCTNSTAVAIPNGRRTCGTCITWAAPPPPAKPTSGTPTAHPSTPHKTTPACLQRGLQRVQRVLHQLIQRGAAKRLELALQVRLGRLAIKGARLFRAWLVSGQITQRSCTHVSKWRPRYAWAHTPPAGMLSTSATGCSRQPPASPSPGSARPASRHAQHQRKQLQPGCSQPSPAQQPPSPLPGSARPWQRPCSRNSCRWGSCRTRGGLQEQTVN